MGKKYKEVDAQELWNVVEAAINSKEFKELNKQVKKVVATSVDVAGKVAVEAGRQATAAAQEAERRRQYQQQQGQRQEIQQQHNTSSHRPPAVHPTQMRGVQGQQLTQAFPAQSLLYTKASSQNVAGILMSIVGYSVAAISGLSALAMLVGSTVVTDAVALFGVGAGASLLFLVAGLALGVAGTKKCGLVSRFRKYTQIIGTRTFCEIDELANRLNIKREKVVKDLKQLIEKRIFTQGCIDYAEEYIFLTDETYQQYLLTEKETQHRALEQKKEEQRQGMLPAECRQILADGREYIRYIRDANDKLPGETISNKLDRLELIITRIFFEVEKNPDLANELRKFMNYYLPTTKKLIETYLEIDRDPVLSNNKQKTKQEIEDTIDTINGAFENLLDSFFADKALDISSDISVLQTMLTQEGLTNTFSIDSANSTK